MLKIKLLSIGLVLALIVGLTLSIKTCQQANALGAQSTEITGTATCFLRFYGPSQLTWDTITNTTPAELDGNKVFTSGYTKTIELTSGTIANQYLVYSRVLLDFVTSGIGGGGEVESGRIKLYIGSKAHNNSAKWSCRLTSFTGVADGDYNLEDWLAQIDVNSVGLAEPILYDTVVTDGWNSFELTDAGLDYINTTGHTAVWIRMSVEALDVEPAWVSGQYVLYTLGTSLPTQNPKIELEYSGAPSDRVIDEKANPDKDAGTGDNVTGISYMTPRNAWSDEKVGFRVEGDDGTQITLNFVSEAGAVLDTISDEIRSNGYFYWYPELDGYAGYFRLVEANKNKISEWGYSEPYSSVGNCVGLAEYLEPEASAWRRNIKDFIVAAHDVMKYYWVSDMTGAELDTVLSVSQDGARQATLLTDNVSDWATGYMRCEDSDNYNLLSSRYILASMDGVSNDYDGLILNFSNPLNTMTHGVYYVGFWNSGSSGFYGSTGYWYCAPDEISAVVSGDFTGGKEITAAVESAMALNLAYAVNTTELGLSQIGRTWNWLDSSGVLGSGAWSNGKLEAMVTPATNGEYTLELRLSADDYTEHRIWDCTVATSGGGAGGGGDGGVDILKDAGSWFNQLLKLLHLDSAGGHWLAICLLALLEVILLWKDKVILTIALCLTVGLGMYAGWIWTWVIIILGMALGFAVFGLLRGRRHAED